MEPDTNEVLINYLDNEILMLGDGNGDLKAVKENNGLFYPINPGSEQDYWNKFPESNKFLAGIKNKL